MYEFRKRTDVVLELENEICNCNNSDRQVEFALVFFTWFIVSILLWEGTGRGMASTEDCETYQ